MSVLLRLNFKKSPPGKPKDVLFENGLSLKGDNGCTVILIHGLTGTPNEMKEVLC